MMVFGPAPVTQLLGHDHLVEEGSAHTSLLRGDVHPQQPLQVGGQEAGRSHTDHQPCPREPSRPP